TRSSVGIRMAAEWRHAIYRATRPRKAVGERQAPARSGLRGARRRAVERERANGHFPAPEFRLELIRISRLCLSCGWQEGEGRTVQEYRREAEGTGQQYPGHPCRTEPRRYPGTIRPRR